MSADEVLCPCRRLPGCPNLAGGLLQAAVECPSSDQAIPMHQQPSADGNCNPDSQGQQSSPQHDRSQGTEVFTQREKLTLDCLMRTRSLADSCSSIAQCGSCREWGSGLGTEWVTSCSHAEQHASSVQQLPHRLYVQASPGEMRLASVMTADV